MNNNYDSNSTFVPERRPRRFKYRHSAEAAAQEVGVPVLWLWYWAFRGRLRSKLWLGQPWFRLENVQDVARSEAVETFLATREYLSESEQQRLFRRWHYLEKEVA